MAAPLVVSDASPLILLSAIGQLHLLGSLFGEVFIAPEVHEEVVVRGSGRRGSAEVAEAAFIIVRNAADSARVQALARANDLGAGEAATLALAESVHASLALMDDRRGRMTARALGIPVAGTVAVCERAYERHLLVDLRAAYLQLQSASGWIAPDIMNSSLERRHLPRLP